MQYGIEEKEGVGIMGRKIGDIGEEDYIAIKFSEYKELLIIKGKYEELKEKSSALKYISEFEPNIQPLTTPYS